MLRDADGCYRLGSKVLYLGSLYQRHFRTSELVPPVLRKLVTDLQEGASFYVADAEYRVVLHRIETSRSVRDSVHEGDRFAVDQRRFRARAARLHGRARRALRHGPPADVRGVFRGTRP